jgi:hypothetical protein
MSGDDQSEFKSLPSLKKEDVLFSIPRNPTTGGNMAVGLEEWIYSKGFRLAAQRLSKQVLHTGGEQCTVVYPIVYLYRHHAELVLKAILRSAFRVLDRELTKLEQKVLGSHDLAELWATVRPMLNTVCERAGDPFFSTDELESVDSYIRQIHEQDSSGQGFRYATKKTKRGDVPSLGEHFWQVDVIELTVFLEQLSEYLEGIEWWLCEVEDARAEVERVHGK